MLQFVNQPFSQTSAFSLKKYSKQEYHQEVNNLSENVKSLENLLMKLRKPYKFPKFDDSFLIRTKYKKNVIQNFLDTFEICHDLFEKEGLNEESMKEVQLNFELNEIFAENEIGQKNAREEMENLLLLSLFYINHISKKTGSKNNKGTNTINNFDKSLFDNVKTEKKPKNISKNCVDKETKTNNYDYSMYIKIIEDKMKEIENLRKKYNQEIAELNQEKMVVKERARVLEEENIFLKEEIEVLKQNEEENEITEKKNRKIKYAIIDEIVNKF